MGGSAGPDPRLRPRGGTQPNLLGPALAVILACACQTVFGDFNVTPAPAVEPTEGLGTACEPGAYRCTDALLETCNDDRSGWIVAETCESPAQCNLNARACRPCIPGETMCRGADLEICDDELAWQLERTCSTAALCTVAPNRRSGECAPSACNAPGAHDCDGSKLTRCSDEQDRIEVVAVCATRELCDPVYANELAASGQRGACRPAACAPDAFSCDGATLRHCKFDRTGWDVVTDCDSRDQCSARRGACAACEPGEVECNGAELRRCADARTWETLRTCASVALCDEATGTCKAGDCDEPGELRCGFGDIPMLEACSADFAWERAGFCATIELCSISAGRCLTPACAENETRCRGSRHERCSTDLTRWDLVATCAEGEVCDATEGCTPGPCTEGSVRCNGPSLERCVSGRFQEEQRCPPTLLCNAESASCAMPNCVPGAFSCDDGLSIKRCRPSGDGVGDYLTCERGQTCDLNPGLGLPECDACVADSYRCEGLELRRCTSDGHEEVKVSSCATTCSLDAEGVPSCDHTTPP